MSRGRFRGERWERFGAILVYISIVPIYLGLTEHWPFAVLALLLLLVGMWLGRGSRDGAQDGR